VVYQPVENRLAILPLGEGGFIPNGSIISNGISFNPIDPPSRIVCNCGPVVFGEWLILEPIGYEADGQIRRINDLSYAPVNGWWRRHPGIDHWTAETENVDGVRLGNSPSIEISQALAKLHVWRTFRVYGIARDIYARDEEREELLAEQGRPARRPILKLDFGGFPQIAERWKVDVLPQLILPERDRSGQYKTKPGRLWANSYRHGVDPGAELQNYAIPTELDISWSVDAQGVITTSTPIFRVRESSLQSGTWMVEPAQVFLYTSVRFRGNDNQVVSHKVQRQVTGRIDVPPLVVRRPEIVPVYVANRNMDKKNWREEIKRTVEQGYIGGGEDEYVDRENRAITSKIIQGGMKLISVASNLADVNSAANYYINAELSRMQQGSGGTRVYAGWLPISPTGAIHQVTWSCDGGEPRTTISLNYEHATWLPAYPERRRNEAVAGMLSNPDYVKDVLGIYREKNL
jgi:hypothetical protein